MKTKPQIMKALFLAFLLTFANGGAAKDFSAKELTQRAIERRAVEAAIWGIPTKHRGRCADCLIEPSRA